MHRLGIEPRKQQNRVLTPCSVMEGNTVDIVRLDISRPCVVEDPIHVQKLFARKSGDPAIDHDYEVVGVRIENP